MIFVMLMLIVFAIVGTFTLGIVSPLIAIILAIDDYQKGEGQSGFISAEMWAAKSFCLLFFDPRI